MEDEVVGAITEPGLLVLLGVHTDDTPEQAETMALELHELRILRTNSHAPPRGHHCLWSVSSLFTVTPGKGRRPSWTAAARPEQAEPLVDAVVQRLRDRGARVATGRFGAMMSVHSVNDGPFTVLVEV